MSDRPAPRRLGTAQRRRLHEPDAALTASAVVEVAFHDADPSGVAWHGNYFRYFDSARCALLERIAYGYRDMARAGELWPIVDTRVRYLAPAAYGERLTVTAALEEWEYRLKIRYRIDNADGRRITDAYTIQVPVDATTGEMRFGVPEPLRARIERLVGDAPE